MPTHPVTPRGPPPRCPSRSRALLAVLLLVSGSAWAAGSPGRQLYERGAYAKASRVLKQEVDDPKRSDKERALSRVYFAATLLELRKESEAQQQLEELARTFPEQQVDPVLFPPALVEMDRAVRGKRDAERLRQEAQRTEQERLAAEAAVKREQAAAERVAAERERLAAEQRANAFPPVTQTEPRRSFFRLRPEVVGYADVVGKSLGGAAGLGVGLGPLELNVRALPGPGGRWGASGEVGLLFGQGVFQPRLALRATGLRTVGFGGGGVVGVRLTPLHTLTLLADVGFEHFFLPSDQHQYKDFVLTTTAGVGFNLL